MTEPILKMQFPHPLNEQEQDIVIAAHKRRDVRILGREYKVYSVHNILQLPTCYTEVILIPCS